MINGKRDLKIDVLAGRKKTERIMVFLDGNDFVVIVLGFREDIGPPIRYIDVPLF